MSDTTTQSGSEQGQSGGAWNSSSGTGTLSGSSTGSGNFEVHGRNVVQGFTNNAWPEYNRWQGWGQGRGDTSRRTVVEDTGQLDNTEIAAPKLAQADLTGINTTTVGQREGDEGGGFFHDSTFGTVTQGSLAGQTPTGKIDPVQGLASLDLYNARAAAGWREKVGVRGQASATGQYGSAVAKGEAYGVAEAGADGYFKLNTRDGVLVGGNASARLGVGASGDADLKTPGLRVAGVDTPLDAGIGAHGEAFAGAKAGLGGRAGIGPNFVGAEGSIGAFAGVEAQGDIHANLGPLRGRVTASGMAGAGIGADGGITYEDGKIKISGRVYAALGLGGSLGGEITLDVKQATQLARAVADADKDGRLTLNDPATHISNAMQGGAKLLDRGADGLINMLDADGSGKFSMDDLRIRARQAGELMSDAKEAVQNGAAWAIDRGHRALDRDGDGRLGWGDVTAGAGQLRNAAANGLNTARDMVQSGARSVYNAADHDGDGRLGWNDLRGHMGDAGQALQNTGRNLLNGGRNVVNTLIHGGSEARDWLSDRAGQAQRAIHGALDADGDGRLGMGDVRAMGTSALNGLNNARHAVQDRVHQLGDSAHRALDRDGDGRLGWNDVRTGASQVRDSVVQRAQQAGQTLHNAADRDGDGRLGWNDVRTGARQVRDSVVSGASNLYNGARSQVTQAASTVANGARSAISTVGGAARKVAGFFGW